MHLLPVDLLQLARTSKELRGHLLSRHSRHLWIAARRNVEPPMPDCLDDFSEPQVTHLAFERTCDACGVSRAGHVDYAVAMRLCKQCWDENVLKGRALAKACGLVNLRGSNSEILKLLPKAGGTSSTVSCLASGFVQQTASNTFYLPEFAFVAQQYQQVLLDNDEEALKEFVDERTASTLRRLKFRLSMETWEELASQLHRTTKGELMAERSAAIMEKLGKLGYSSSDIADWRPDIWAILDQPRKLTPRIWNAIEPVLVPKLEEERKRVAEWKFQEKWHRRRTDFQQRYVACLQEDRRTDERKRTLPCFVDILPRMQHLLTATEPDVNVSADEVAAMADIAIAYREEYLAEVRSALARVSRRTALPSLNLGYAVTREQAGDAGDAADEAADSALLELPTSLFECRGYHHKECQGAKSWLAMVEHWQHDYHISHSLSANLKETEHAGVDASRVSKLAKALGLPEDAKLPAVLDTIKEGRPECVCSKQPLYWLMNQPRYQLFSLLLHHVEGNGKAWLSRVVHKITFTPTYEKKT